MPSERILKELNKRIIPICRTDEELSAIPLYVETDKYRQKLIDYIDIAKKRGDEVTGDQLMILLITLSNEEEKDTEL